MSKTQYHIPSLYKELEAAFAPGLRKAAEELGRVYPLSARSFDASQGFSETDSWSIPDESITVCKPIGVTVLSSERAVRVSAGPHRMPVMIVEAFLSEHDAKELLADKDEGAILLKRFVSEAANAFRKQLSADRHEPLYGNYLVAVAPYANDHVFLRVPGKGYALRCYSCCVTGPKAQGAPNV